jgi:hypothetical protein
MKSPSDLPTNCSLCGTKVKAVGGVTRHYQPVRDFAMEEATNIFSHFKLVLKDKSTLSMVDEWLKKYGVRP